MATMNSKFNSKCPFCKQSISKGDKISNERGKWGHEICPEIDVNENEDVAIPVKVQSAFIPSNYQQSIFDFISTGTGNLAVSATAGSGKTRTIQEAIKLLPKSASWVYLVFNKKNQVEAQEKFGELTNGNISTFHSLCLNEAIKPALGKVRIDDKKSYRILETISDQSTQGELWPNVVKVVGLIKNTLTNEDSFDDLSAMIAHYGIELNGDQGEVISLAREVIKSTRNMSNVIDFDDMIWFPVIKNLSFRSYDYVFVDEVQDLNAVQIEIVMKLRNLNTRVVVVGDRNQALYGFRGALDDSFDRVVTALRATELPLSLCYRNSKAVGAFINNELPQITHNVLDNAPAGSVTTIKDVDLFKHVAVGDMVVCRVNAPLVRPAFSLIRNGIKAVIMGREIGTEIVNLIHKVAKRAGTDNLELALQALAEYQSKEMYRLIAQGKDAIAQSLEDKCETIFALSEGCNTLADLELKAETIFSDKEAGVVFSSVHRAKGLEADNVFVLRYDLLPHPMAVKSGQAWQIKQEMNCKFVALSRAKVNLTIVEETKRDKQE